MEQIIPRKPPSKDCTGSQEIISLYPFPNNIYIEEKSKAAAFAHEIYKQGTIPRCLVLWVDGSYGGPAYEKPSACAIGYHDPRSGEWREYVTISLIDSGSSAEAELLAVREGFHEAAALSEHFDRLLIFSDCQNILGAIKVESRFFKFLQEMHLVNDIFEHANEMYNLGIRTELHWVPAKAHVEGHVRVDLFSRLFRELATSLWPKDRIACTAAIKNIRLIPGPLEPARVFLRGIFSQAQEPGSVVHNERTRLLQ